MSEAGFEVYFIDRRGSGGNQRDRGDARGPKQLTRDVAAYVDFARSRHPDLPVVLLAISWGGKLAVAAIKENPELVDAAVFVCPGWFAKVHPSLKEQCRIAWSYLTNPARKLPIPLSDPALFTANPEKQEYIRRDERSLREGTARLLLSSRLLDAAIRDAPARIHIPCLLFSAGRDRIVDSDKNERYFSRFASAARAVIRYPDAHHTLEFEPDPEPFFEDLVAWLRSVCR